MYNIHIVIHTCSRLATANMDTVLPD